MRWHKGYRMRRRRRACHSAALGVCVRGVLVHSIMQTSFMCVRGCGAERCRFFQQYGFVCSTIRRNFWQAPRKSGIRPASIRNMRSPAEHQHQHKYPRQRKTTCLVCTTSRCSCGGLNTHTCARAHTLFVRLVLMNILTRYRA